MDVPLSPLLQKRRQAIRRFWRGGAVVMCGLIALGLFRLEPALPRVEKSSIWIDTVKRGQMLRQVRGNGTLVPEDIRWIPTINPGRVDRILVLPGAAVKSNTVIVELSNPEVEQAVFEAEWQIKAAEADLANLRVQLASQKLSQQAAVATAKANYNNAKSDLEVNEELSKSGLVPSLTVKQSTAKTEELAKLFEIEQERLKMSAESDAAQIAVQEAKIAQIRAQLELKRRQAGALKVRAGMDGVLQRLGNPSNPLQLGEQLSAGSLVARVANPAKLKAEIKIAETQARDIQLEQPATIDTRNGTIPGHVVRIDPAVANGTVTVDVALDTPLPRGARPDLTVDGTVELERLTNVLYVGRPVQAQAEGNAELYRVVEGSKLAVRVNVKLGHNSVSTIEVLAGLQDGDRLILSDMSQWNSHERLRLE